MEVILSGRNSKLPPHQDDFTGSIKVRCAQTSDHNKRRYCTAGSSSFQRRGRILTPDQGIATIDHAGEAGNAEEQRDSASNTSEDKGLS